MTDVDRDAPMLPWPVPRPDPFDLAPLFRAALGDAGLGQAPLRRLRLWTGQQVWLVTRHADVRTVLASPAFSADPLRPGYPLGQFRENLRVIGHTMIRLDPPAHTRYRRALSAYFTARRVSSLRSRVTEIVNQALDELIAAPPPVDLVELLARPVPSRMICSILGVPYTDHATFEHHSGRLLDAGLPRAENVRSGTALRDYLTDLVEHKQRCPDSGLIAAMLSDWPADPRRLAASVAEHALMLLFAGHETTSSMISLGSLFLLRNPALREALRLDPALVPGTVEEMLRYFSVVHFGVVRAALSDTEVGGQQIRAGEGVLTLLQTANRDSTLFDAPDTFDPHRTPNGHLAFGYGIHRCIGQHLARLELETVFTELSRRVPRLRLDPAAGQLRFSEAALTIYGLARLPVRC